MSKNGEKKSDTRPADPGFCVYEWTGPKPPTPKQIEQVHGKQECALSVAMARRAAAGDPRGPARWRTHSSARHEGSQTPSLPRKRSRKRWRRAPKMRRASPCSTPRGSASRGTRRSLKTRIQVNRIVADLACPDPKDDAGCGRNRRHPTRRSTRKEGREVATRDGRQGRVHRLLSQSLRRLRRCPDQTAAGQRFHHQSQPRLGSDKDGSRRAGVSTR